MLAKIKHSLLLAVLFLLPWPTRLIYQAGELNGQFWEYGTLSLYGIELLLWLCIALHIMEFFVARPAFDRSNRNKRLIIGAIIVVVAVTALVRSPLPEVTQQFLVWLMAAASLAILLMTRRDSEPYWWALWLGGVVQALVGVGQFVSQQVVANKWLGLAVQNGGIAGSGVVETVTERWLRAYGSWGGPNPFGSYLAIILVLGCLLYVRQTGWRQAVVLCGQSVVALGLFLSFSRGAWLAALGGLVLLMLTQKQKTKLGGLVGVMGVVVAVWLACLFPLVSERVAGEGRLQVRSVSDRRSQYSEAWEVLKHNTLFGTGPRMYTYVLARDFGIVKFQPIHNSFALMLVELGAVVGLLVVVIFGRWVHWVWAHNRELLPLVIVFVVAALFEHFFWSLLAGLLLTGAVIGFSLNKKLPT